MAFKTDNGGLALKADIKICGGSTWNTRLSQIGRNAAKVDICTYSLPDLDYMAQIFDKRSDNVRIIAHEKFIKKAQALKNKYPNLDIYLLPDTHAKFVLIEPHIVWLSSANFGSSGWFEHTVGIHNIEAYQYLIKQFNYQLSRASRVQRKKQGDS